MPKTDISALRMPIFPDRTVTSLFLDKPEDIFIDTEDYLYIADTGNKRIVKYNPARDQIVMEIKHELIQSPTGVYVTQNGDIYVADIASSHVVIFSKDGHFKDAIGRPTSPAFGSNDFNPMKVAVDGAGNIYVLGEGIYDGIIQLARTGEFLGFCIQQGKLDICTKASGHILYRRTETQSS